MPKKDLEMGIDQMFTGIIEGLGTIRAVSKSGNGGRFTIDAGFRLEGTNVGDSIAVSGACLTAVRLDGSVFTADVSPETLSKTTFGRAGVGTKVNIERALRLSDRIDGHLVSGHIDGTGEIAERKTESNAEIVTVRVPESLAVYMIAKGSVAVDGISLTINECGIDWFSVSIIPHTAKLTTIGLKKTGEPVNIETDMIGKYVERFVGNFHGISGKSSLDKENKRTGIDLNFLAKHGF